MYQRTAATAFFYPFFGPHFTANARGMELVFAAVLKLTYFVVRMVV